MLLEENLEFAFAGSTKPARSKAPLHEQLLGFSDFNKVTRVINSQFTLQNSEPSLSVPIYVNEYWTAKQRAAHSLHEISYRACFKPQLPRFFIERLTEPGDVVYDPFTGRGTTALEAALLGRVPLGCDINPLSVFLTAPRLSPPVLGEITTRLRDLDLSGHDELPEELLVFYHRETLKELCALKKYLLERRDANELDSIDRWIWMMAINRLTGHSPGFFSVYTLPPNQAVSVQSQKRINEQRSQKPAYRNVADLICRKTRNLLSDCDTKTRRILSTVAPRARLITGDSSATPDIADESVSLVVTSPPFLDVVDYATDNWLRCWFIGIDAKSVRLTVPKKLEAWQSAMKKVFCELRRVLRRGGHIAFEVGEVRGGKVKLEEAVVPVAVEAGLNPLLILINDQKFTKTANCWGVDNNSKGTNTNRIVVFRNEK